MGAGAGAGAAAEEGTLAGLIVSEGVGGRFTGPAPSVLVPEATDAAESLPFRASVEDLIVSFSFLLASLRSLLASLSSSLAVADSGREPEPKAASAGDGGGAAVSLAASFLASILSFFFLEGDGSPPLAGAVPCPWSCWSAPNAGEIEGTDGAAVDALAESELSSAARGTGEDSIDIIVETGVGSVVTGVAAFTEGGDGALSSVVVGGASRGTGPTGSETGGGPDGGKAGGGPDGGSEGGGPDGGSDGGGPDGGTDGGGTEGGSPADGGRPPGASESRGFGGGGPPEKAKEKAKRENNSSR